MTYRSGASERFWTSFYALSPDQKESTRRAWAIFRVNPFDARLRPHKIQRLSAALGKTVHAIDIEGDLRVVFYLQGDLVWTIDIGSHQLYRADS